MDWEYHCLLFFQGLHTPVMDKIMIHLSHLGDFGVMWTAFAILLFLMKRTRLIGRDMLLSILLTALIGNLILKNLIDRPRPYDVYAVLQPLVEKPFDSAFPSGHTMNAFTAATALFFHERQAGAAALLVACAISFSRLYNLVHYPTDVLAGAVIGIGCALSVCRIFHSETRKRMDLGRLQSH